MVTPSWTGPVRVSLFSQKDKGLCPLPLLFYAFCLIQKLPRWPGEGPQMINLNQKSLGVGLNSVAEKTNTLNPITGRKAGKFRDSAGRGRFQPGGYFTDG